MPKVEEKKQEQEQEQKSQMSPEVKELKEQLATTQAQSQKMQQVLSNPTIQKVLAKLSAGEEVNLEDKQPMKEEQELSLSQQLVKKPKSSDLNLDSLSNTELVEIIAETVEGFVTTQKESAGKDFAKEFASMGSELKRTQEALYNVIATQNVANVKNRFPDFDIYKESISKAIEKYPALSIEDAYKLAKADHVQSVPNRASLESEKPESSTSVPTWTPNHSVTRSEDDEERLPLRGVGGARGFRASLNKVLDKKLSNK
jgi:hypothetical protein